MNLLRKDLVIFATVVLVSLILYRFSSDHATQPGPTSTATGHKSSNPPQNLPPSQSETSPPPAAMTPPQDLGPSGKPELPEAVTESRSHQVSVEAKNRFMETANVDLQLPEDLPFQDLDLPEENLTAIYSRSPGMEVAVIAAKGSPKREEILQFITSRETGIPNLDRTSFSLEKNPSTFRAQTANGTGTSQVWKGRMADGQEIHLAVVPRLDGQGTYFFVVSGKAESIDSRDDDFEAAYQNLRARPLK